MLFKKSVLLSIQILYVAVYSIILTHILRNQNLASYLKTLKGFIKKIIMMTVNDNGFTNEGMLRLSLYMKLNTLNVHTTPNMEATSMRSCSVRWFRGSSSNISTWFTPEDLHPYTLTPMRKMNSMMSNGPRYSWNATFKLSFPLSWNIAKNV